MANEVYMMVYSIKFDKDWWKLDHGVRRSILNKAEEITDKFNKELISVKKFSSLSQNSDIIYWLSSFNTSPFSDFRSYILSAFEGYALESNLFLSVFRPSPYMKSNFDPKTVLGSAQLKYFVAYPMKKSPEWYLLPFEEREKIMKEHIDMAINNPKNNGIKSYTTYSFGIGDYEFVVIYEIPELSNWVDVVEKLREAKARKWIIKEEPLLVGETKSLDFLV
ncbi:chlorite dismutase family protein [Acidianus sp. HS-5]|uniref:chlorite dismutase family protein n=1 Tax=Acidianus sp. HS-5 TaxID=2886040 RepID=UPI001F009FA4|nr:chlorite dismutase family protein [Acidianus sp. HS-5]BDC18350.1 chlorite dismutase [Acidianus sp. HS-5]